MFDDFTVRAVRYFAKKLVFAVRTVLHTFVRSSVDPDLLTDIRGRIISYSTYEFTRLHGSKS